MQLYMHFLVLAPRSCGLRARFYYTVDSTLVASWVGRKESCTSMISTQCTWQLWKQTSAQPHVEYPRRWFQVQIGRDVSRKVDGRATHNDGRRDGLGQLLQLSAPQDTGVQGQCCSSNHPSPPYLYYTAEAYRVSPPKFSS